LAAQVWLWCVSQVSEWFVVIPQGNDTTAAQALRVKPGRQLTDENVSANGQATPLI
jgi:hypothetical protein